jgi:2-oxoglutarate dehydrogenase E1 component
MEYLFRADPAYIESLWAAYLDNPASVPIDWQRFFEGYQSALDGKFSPPVSDGRVEKEFAVIQLIAAYRNQGHLYARTNPLASYEDHEAQLDQAFALERFGLSREDLSRTFQAGKLVGLGPLL